MEQNIDQREAEEEGCEVKEVQCSRALAVPKNYRTIHLGSREVVLVVSGFF